MLISKWKQWLYLLEERNKSWCYKLMTSSYRVASLTYCKVITVLWHVKLMLSYNQEDDGKPAALLVLSFFSPCSVKLGVVFPGWRDELQCSQVGPKVSLHLRVHICSNKSSTVLSAVKTHAHVCTHAHALCCDKWNVHNTVWIVLLLSKCVIK